MHFAQPKSYIKCGTLTSTKLIQPISLLQFNLEQFCNEGYFVVHEQIALHVCHDKQNLKSVH